MEPEIKAELISIGAVNLDRSLLGRITIPTAGPGAGNTAFFLKSGRHRVRLTVNEGSPLKAVMDKGEIVILKGGNELVRGHLEEELIHCPGQAYITISEKCVYNCKFCPVPKLGGKVKSLDEVLELVDMGYSSGMMEAISITSGVEETAEKEVKRAIEVLNAVKKYNVPIGVSIYPTQGSSASLKKAGADEIKYNVETMDRDLYPTVCPDQELDEILWYLREAVDIFGKNKVFSNFIIGLGESDEIVEKGLEELASLGIIPILRAGGVHPLRMGDIDIERPTKYRLLKLTKVLRNILDKHGLRADISRTMCLPCTACDLNPHIDLE
ncbi:radical SAM protein [Methanohalophilus mahii]|uniref:Radical SAM domain protein n=1 Tax=Methanohalophilus mahii (strain ATCC 35705 / DSM 5219 / SLP) TaxID=547558 RepID=D5EAL9_METMS|nr:radical SAM protein [Methanohalophilus mahii]ADE36220.1 Radical SAM domain protein [Methanohalophilus mahii DSM 5219]